MALISGRVVFTTGGTIYAADHNTNDGTIWNDYNGNITNANISASAAIADTKLAQITTSAKVSGAALTSLSSTPSGAGVMPIANLASGTPDGTKFIRDDGALAVALTSVTGIIGAAVSKSDNTAYQAATDGFFIGVIVAGSSVSAGKIVGYSDSNSSPSTVLGGAHVWVNTGNASESAQLNYGSFCIPVKKNNYYKGVLSSTSNAPTATYYFIPLGS